MTLPYTFALGHVGFPEEQSILGQTQSLSKGGQ